MNRTTHTKIVPIIYPAILQSGADFVGANGDTTPVNVDTSGYDHCTIYVFLGVCAADIAEGPDVYSFATSMTTDTGTLVTGSAMTEPTTTTDVGFHAIDIPLGGDVGRYLTLGLKAGAGNSYACAFAILSKKGGQQDNNITSRGLTALAQAIN